MDESHDHTETRPLARGRRVQLRVPSPPLPPPDLAHNPEAAYIRSVLYIVSPESTCTHYTRPRPRNNKFYRELLYSIIRG